MRPQFTHPQWLWLLPFVLGWVWWWARNSDVQLSPLRRRLASAFRLGIAAAVVLALAGLQIQRPIEGMNVFFVLDQSESISSAQQQAARDWINQVAAQPKERDRAGLVVFGADASIESSPANSLRFEKIESVVPAKRTDIGAAVRLAAAAFPEHGQRRIVLLSDGNENLGNALDAAAAARALDIDVDIVPLGEARRNDVSVERLQMPSHIKKGQAFEAKVFANADQPGPATVSLYRNEQFLGKQTVQLDRGKNLFSFPQTLSEPGFYSYEVRLEADGDSIPQNNRAIGFAQVQGLPRVLIVSSDPAADAPLADALKSSEIDSKLVSVHEFPDSLPLLQSYDSIMLCNVSAYDLGRDQQEMLETAVRDFGVGFVCVGGDNAYAAGAYQGTALERILPVDMELNSKKVLPAGGLVLIIDKSGSMAGEKMETAKQAAMGAVDLLAARDYVGVLAFDGEVYQVADMQPASNKRDIINAIAAIHAGGGTVMYPPMYHAWEMLKKTRASIKHCIILTDGVSQPGDFMAITRAMADDRITVSTVGVGGDIDVKLLDEIARVGKGRFYDVTSPSDIPQIFIKETAVVLKTAINEEPFTPQLAASTEMVRGIGAKAYPQLLGYVATEPKPKAEVPLVTQRGDPLLAHWQHGLGRTVAFTSDARAKWARNWTGWSGYRQFWRQVTQWSLRRLENADFNAQVVMEHGDGRVTVEALDDKGNYRNFLDLQATVIAPDRSRQTITLQQNGPGHYEAGFAMREEGAYMLNLVQMEKGRPLAAQTIGASLNYSPELGAQGANLNLLQRIAAATGGKMLGPGPAGNPFYHDRRVTWQPFELWPWLLRFAILAFVVEVGIRRIQPDPDEWRKFWRGALAFVPFFRAKPAPAAAAEASLDALLATRDEVRARRPAPVVRAPTFTSPPPAAGETPTVAPPPEPPPSAPEAEGQSTTNRLLEARRRANTRRQ